MAVRASVLVAVACAGFAFTATQADSALLGTRSPGGPNATAPAAPGPGPTTQASPTPRDLVVLTQQLIVELISDADPHGTRLLLQDLLKYLRVRYYTVWESPDGSKRVERLWNGAFGTPSFLNLDGKQGPDVTATLGLNGVDPAVTIERLPGQTAPIGASVEVIIDDPTGRRLGSDFIAFGYDQLGDRIPHAFRAQVRLGELLLPAGDTVLDVKLNQALPGDDTDLIASFFDGTPENRTQNFGVRMELENSYRDANLRLTLGDPLLAKLTTDTTGPARAFVDIGNGAEAVSLSALVEDLPEVMDLTIGLSETRFRYEGHDKSGAEQGIDHLRVEATAAQPFFGAVDHVRATALDFPSGVEVSIGPGVEAVADQPIGTIEAFLGSEAEQPGDLPSGSEQGVRYVDASGSPFVIGARILGLREFVFGLAPLSVSTKTKPNEPLSVEAIVDNPALLPFALEANGVIENLPSELDVCVDMPLDPPCPETPDGAALPHITYGASEEIGKIDLEAKTEPAVVPELGLNEFKVLLEGIPKSFGLDLGFAPVDGAFAGFAFNSTDPIDSIEATAKSSAAIDESSVLGADQMGAVARLLEDETFAFVRVLELKHLGVGLDPISVSTETKPNEPFLADAIVDNSAVISDFALEATGLIEDLPAKLAVCAGLPSGERCPGTPVDAQLPYITYDAFGEEIGKIDLEAKTDPAVVPELGLKEFEALLEGIPAKFDLELGFSAVDDSFRGFDFNSTNAIDSVEVQANSSGATEPDVHGTPDPDDRNLDAAEQGAVARLLEDQTFAFARVLELKHLGIGLDPISVSTVTKENEPFLADAIVDNPALLALGLDATALIENLPSTLEVCAGLPGGESCPGTPDDAELPYITYSASALIETLDVEMTTDPALMPEIELNTFEALLSGIPTSFGVGLDFDAGGGFNGFSYDSTSSIASIEAVAKSAFAADERTVLGPQEMGAVVRSCLGCPPPPANANVNQTTFAFVRVLELEHFGIGLDPISVSTETKNGPFRVDADIQNPRLLTAFAGKATAEIKNLPSTLDLCFELQGDQLCPGRPSGAQGPLITYDASSKIDSIDLDASSTVPIVDLPDKGITLSTFAALLKGIPTSMDLTLDLPRASSPGRASFDGFGFGASTAIDSIEGMAKSAGAAEVAVNGTKNLNDRDLDADEQGAVLRALDGSTYAFARVLELRKLKLDMSPSVFVPGGADDPMRIETQAKKDQFLADAVVGNPKLLDLIKDSPNVLSGLPLTATAVIKNLPSSLDMVLDLGGGFVRYEGEAISSIDLRASANPFYKSTAYGVTLHEVEAVLSEIPKSFDLLFHVLGEGNGQIWPFSPGPGIGLDLSNPIGSIEAMVKSTGATDVRSLVPAGEMGAVARALPDSTFAFARVLGLEDLDVGLAPVSLFTRTATGKPFVADAVIENPALVTKLGFPLKATGRIVNLPGEIDLTADIAAGQIDYRAKDAITKIDLKASSTASVYSKPDLAIDLSAFEALVETVPKVVDVDLSFGEDDALQGFTFTGRDGTGATAQPASIGKLVAMARSNSSADYRTRIDSGTSGAVARIEDGFVCEGVFDPEHGQFPTCRPANETFLFGRLQDLTSMKIGLDPIEVETTAASAKPFAVDADIRNPQTLSAFGLDVDELRGRADASSLPTSLDICVGDVDDEGVCEAADGSLVYDASAAITSLSASVDTGSDLLLGDLNLSRFATSVKDVPTQMEIGYDEGFSFDASSAVTSMVALANSPGVSPNTVFAQVPDAMECCPITTTGAIARLPGADATNFVFAAAAGIGDMSIGLDPLEVHTNLGGGKPLFADLEVGDTDLLGFPLDVTADVKNLPSKLDLCKGEFGTSGVCTASTDDGIEIDYSASAGITKLTATANDLELPGFESSPADFHVDMDGLPSTVDMRVGGDGHLGANQAEGTQVKYNASSPITSLHVGARDLIIPKLGKLKPLIGEATSIPSQFTFEVAAPGSGFPIASLDSNAPIGSLQAVMLADATGLLDLGIGIDTALPEAARDSAEVIVSPLLTAATAQLTNIEDFSARMKGSEPDNDDPQIVQEIDLDLKTGNTGGGGKGIDVKLQLQDTLLSSVEQVTASMSNIPNTIKLGVDLYNTKRIVADYTASEVIGEVKVNLDSLGGIYDLQATAANISKSLDLCFHAGGAECDRWPSLSGPAIEFLENPPAPHGPVNPVVTIDLDQDDLPASQQSQIGLDLRVEPTLGGDLITVKTDVKDIGLHVQINPEFSAIGDARLFLLLDTQSENFVLHRFFFDPAVSAKDPEGDDKLEIKLGTTADPAWALTKRMRMKTFAATGTVSLPGDLHCGGQLSVKSDKDLSTNVVTLANIALFPASFTNEFCDK